MFLKYCLGWSEDSSQIIHSVEKYKFILEIKGMHLKINFLCIQITLYILCKVKPARYESIIPRLNFLANNNIYRRYKVDRKVYT
jgi:hypothetical protein